jgi:hypothetical protein
VHPHDVQYVLAGSIRDDGPLPDTIMDLRVAQDCYADALQDVRSCSRLSTMLHGIGVGNMLPSWVKMVCVDINPAVVTKLADRGRRRRLGSCTDVGFSCTPRAEAEERCGRGTVLRPSLCNLVVD